MTAEERFIGTLTLSVECGDVEVHGRNIHFAKAGHGPAVILLHGINMGWGQWYPNIAPLAAQCTVYAIDLPGAGASSALMPWDPRVADVLVESVEGFIAQQKIEGAHLVGHSLGGWVALKLAMRGKVKIGRVVLTSPLGFSTATPAKYRPLGILPLATLLSRTVMSVTPEHMYEFATSVLAKPAALDRAFSDYYCETLRVRGHAYPFLWINRFSGVRHIRPEFVLLNDMHRVAVPVLVISGAKDSIIPPDGPHLAAFRTLPQVTIDIFPDSGHVPATESAAKFNNDVLQFLIR